MGVNTNKQSRKWLLTINNPATINLTRKKVQQVMLELKSVTYWCMSTEKGENGTTHYHIFVYSPSAIRFTTIKNLFPTAHIDFVKGTAEQNRDYVFKQGKWVHEKKAETNIPSSHFSFGELPAERQGSRNDLHDLYDMVKNGMSTYEILEVEPSYMSRIDTIERVRQMYKEEQYKNTIRQVEVQYIYGQTGTGKTRGVMDKYGYTNVFRVTDYLHPFDNYKGQDVIIFEEFRSSLKIQDMLNYLDIYPLELPCRYTNKVACFTKVYIITNIPLNEQYSNVQIESKETWLAFCRRIQTVLHYTSENEPVLQSVELASKQPFYKQFTPVSGSFGKHMFEHSQNKNN